MEYRKPSGEIPTIAFFVKDSVTWEELGIGSAAFGDGKQKIPRVWPGARALAQV